MLAHLIDADEFVYQTALRREKEDGYLVGWEVFVLLCGKNPWFKENKWSANKQKLQIVNLAESDLKLLTELINTPVTWRTDTSEGVSSIFGDHSIAWWLNWFERQGIKLKSDGYRKLRPVDEAGSNTSPQKPRMWLFSENEKKERQIFHSIRELSEKRRKDPYTYSGLSEYFLLDTWTSKEALCLLSGIHPQGADIEWGGYFNFADVHLDQPNLINCQPLDESDLFYIIPYDHESQKNMDDAEGSIARKIEKLTSLQQILGRLTKVWISGAHNSRNSPQYYIDWATKKGFKIQWLNWAIQNKLVAKQKDLSGSEAGRRSETDAVDKQLSTRERNTLLRIIRALCVAQGLDLKQPYKAAEILKNQIELSGHSISLETIANKLDQARQS